MNPSRNPKHQRGSIDRPQYQRGNATIPSLTFRVPMVVLALLCVTSEAHSADVPGALTVAPAQFMLRGERAYQQLLVTAEFEDGRTGDLTRDAKFEVADSAIAEVSASGVVTPKRGGTTVVTIRHADKAQQAIVTVVGLGEPAPVDFRTDVIAAISRAGCSQGACHGSPQGKDGFRFSLRGFDPEIDMQTLTREAGGRRVNVYDPKSSLILLKGTATVPHVGGVRFKEGDWSYETIRSWIAEGCQVPKQSRELVSLETIPSRRELQSGFPKQQIIAIAKFSDGTIEDVSRLAVFSTKLNPAVDVSNDGLVEFNRTGEATILVRYLQQVRSVPLTYVERDPSFTFSGPTAANEIDRQIFAKQQLLQLNPAALAGDEVFLRRVFLDVTGTLPSATEARLFLESTDPAKRERLIDQLLARDEYASFWAMKWADVMRGNRVTVSQRGVHSLHRYLVNSFAEDRPFDELARDLVTGQGNTLHRPGANFFRISPTPEDAAESFAQLFLGVRMQCAKCHNHPFETLTQTDYYGLAAYFARVKIKGKQFGFDDEIVYLSRQGEVQHPLTRKNLDPIALGSPAGMLGPDDDRREKLADWLTKSDNRLFARSTVNRIWYHLLGRGIVDPVDDFRDTNPPSHPELLDALAEQFVREGYRFKPVIRSILMSRTYQLSAEHREKASPQAADPARYYTKSIVRMLTGEQIVDAVSSAVGIPEKFKGYPEGTRAIELAEGSVENDFLMSFSRPVRDAACDCAREDEPSLNEVLHLMNNSELVQKIESPLSNLGRWLKDEKPTSEIVELVYLTTLSRKPTPREIALAGEHLASVSDRAIGLRDLQHALLNSNEFLLRH